MHTSRPALPLNRNTSLDNIKGLLIFLVVFGHLVELHIASDAFLRPIWILIYTFHMPMFAMVSGMLSKPDLNQQQSSQLIRNILAPLLAFELLYELTEYALTGSFSVYAKLIAPYWMLWYLLSLLSWRLLLPLFARLQFPVLIAVLLAMAASYSEHSGYLMSAARTLTFFPFFVLGWTLGPDFFQRWKSKPQWLLLSLLICGSAIVAAMLLPKHFDYRWLYGSFSLHRLGMANLTGSMYQLVQYLSCTVIGLAVCYLMSRRNWGLARIGQQSMYVFLWHGMALIILHNTGLLNRILHLEDTARLLVSLGASALIVWLAAHPYCELLTKKLILQPAQWLLLQQDSKTEQVTSSAKGESRHTG
ncbi:acyltransferase family protein [Undibacterium curvum]|uniref:acyltransferase family protein n=1 Tax=Undibacterium curvum TaxID=2762294 RepID=UPI003D0EDD3C